MNPFQSLTYANGGAPFAVTATQTAFYAAGALLLILGVRAGTVRAGSARWMRRENINLPVLWLGVTIFGLGAVFSIVTGVVWFSLFRVVASILTAGLTVYIAWGVRRLQHGIESGVINDYADELDEDEDEDEDEDDATQDAARLHGRVLRAEIHDYDDERQHRDEHRDH